MPEKASSASAKVILEFGSKRAEVSEVKTEYAWALPVETGGGEGQPGLTATDIFGLASEAITRALAALGFSREEIAKAGMEYLTNKRAQMNAEGSE